MSDNTEVVSVFCRLKPVDNKNIERCITFQNDHSITAVPPEGTRRNVKETTYSFSKVFRDDSTQSEIFNEVAFPLVDNLLKNKNGLLFTYGVTGSGKSYTMEGTKSNPGIVGRTLKALFSRLNLLMRYRIRPNDRNDFEIYDCANSIFEVESKRNENSRRSSNFECKEYMRQIEADPFEKKVEKNCAVFISMVEMSANVIKDLFCKNGPIMKIKEDRRGNKYLSNVKEVEVQSAEEALYWYLKGIKRRKTSATECNNQSSRTHCIFIIRLAKLSGDRGTEFSSFVDEDLCVTQLSLVDLAGSERAKRTGASGAQLKEAGEINKSLTALQDILKNLRERRKCNGERPFINYRDNALTHLFKNNFEGSCSVRMIICIQQGLLEFDETSNVLKFAEDAKEVRITIKENVFLPKTPRMIIKQETENKEEVEEEKDEDFDEVLSKYAGELDKLYSELEPCRMVHQKELDNDNEMIKVVEFLLEKQEKLIDIQTEMNSIFSGCDFSECSDQFQSMTSKLNAERLENSNLKKRLRELEGKFDQKIRTKEEDNVLKQMRLKNQIEKTKNRNSIRSNPIKSVKYLKQKFEIESKSRRPNTDVNTNRFVAQTPLATKKGYFNPNFRRSKSGENYYQHKEKDEIPAGTLNKLNLKNQISSKKLDLGQLKKVDKYVLQHQSVNDNQFQVDYHSGDVIPTAGGGVSVCLTEMESVIQSPYESTKRKRKSSDSSNIDEDKKRFKDYY